MATQLLTYDELATAWGVSREAARKKVEGLRLPKQTGNDGRARIMVDLDDVQHRPMPKKERKSPGDRLETEALRQHVETLRVEAERLLALAATNRADFERERDRADKAVADLVALADRLSEAERVRAEKVVEAEKIQAEVERVQAEAEQARAELDTWKARPWWRRALG